MKKEIKNVYQFKISMPDIEPLIWRQIQVPENYNFWDLHVAIQDAMGWQDCHLHSFEAIKRNRNGTREYIGIPDGDFADGCIAGWNVPITSRLLKKGDAMIYQYDLGDSWDHIIKLEKILPAEEGVKYPRCIDGERACPPEDCGGFPGYYNLLEVLSDPKHEEYKHLRSWVGKAYNPEVFDHTKVKFTSSKRRLNQLLKEI